KLSPTALMVLHPGGCGRVSHRRPKTKKTQKMMRGAPTGTPHHLFSHTQKQDNNEAGQPGAKQITVAKFQPLPGTNALFHFDESA
ncbi:MULTISPECIES: hypothetical protein, partial [unclassified Corynebacterium]|uniref:hypothetical protein n=1 Tax=unclassified Corynebacterium TaxID=2624378 RepID=UPI00211B882A